MDDVTVANDEILVQTIRRQAALASLWERALGQTELDELISDGLQLILTTLGADHTELLGAGRTGDPLVAWLGHPSQTRVEGRAEAFGNLTVAVAELAAEVPASGDPLSVIDLRERPVPVTAKAQAGEATRHGVAGALLLPLSTRDHGSCLLGVFTLAPRTFSSEETDFVRQVAMIIAGSINQLWGEDTLRWRSQLDQLLTEVSTRFINLPAKAIGGALHLGLELVSDFIGAERGEVFLTDQDQDFEPAAWISTGTEAGPWPGPEPVGDVQTWREQLRLGQTVEVMPCARPGATEPARSGGCVADPEAPRVRSVPPQPDPLTFLLPMRASGRLLGYIAFAASHQTRPWHGGVAAALLPLGHVFAQAVADLRRVTELEDSEVRYKTLVEEVRDVIVRVDGTGQISFVNTAWTELTGLSIEETLKRNAFESIHPEDHQIAAEHIASVTRGEDNAARSVRFIAKDGSCRWMEVKGRALFDEKGDFAGLNGVLHDVTENKLAEAKTQSAFEEAVRAREEAERASDAKSEFLSRMSHELRTPLNAILGFTELLEYAELGEEDAEGLSLIMQAGRHLLDLINDAMDISRMDAGQMALSAVPVDILGIWNESVDLLRSASAARSLTIELPYPAEVRIGVLADRIRLKQVLVNVLSNAIKYNRDGGSVTLRCRQLEPDEGPLRAGGQRFARISVVDTGIGIPADQLGQVFEPFHRLGHELTEVEGTGIGLTLARSLVEAMGGQMGLTSTQHIGTTFFIDLPTSESAGRSEGMQDVDATAQV